MEGPILSYDQPRESIVTPKRRDFLEELKIRCFTRLQQ